MKIRRSKASAYIAGQLPVSFEADESIPSLHDVYNITLYRLLQEALNNIVKHANATHAWVEVTAEDDIIALTIQDNGRGFDQMETKPDGMGLASMNERVTIAGGNLKISSTPERGTIISAEFPLPVSQKVMEKS